MKWKPRVVIAAVVLIASMAFTCFGLNHFIESIGWMSAGWLFGTAQQVPRTKEGE